MSKNEMVSVPRELAEEIISALYDHDLNGLTVRLQELLDRPEQHQGEPVLLPMRRSWSGIAGWRDQAEIKAWNACLDEIAKLGPLYTHPAPAVQKRYNSRTGSEKHDGTTLAVLTLGAFDASELGDIDIKVRVDNAEALQQRLVSTEDIHVDLVSAEWARGLEQEVEDCWGTIDKMHMQALGAEDRAKEIADLRAKLAERDTLLRRALEYIRADGGFTLLDDEIETALTASPLLEMKS